MLRPSFIVLYFVTVEILFSVSLSTTSLHTDVKPLQCGGDVSVFSTPLNAHFPFLLSDLTHFPSQASTQRLLFALIVTSTGIFCTLINLLTCCCIKEFPTFHNHFVGHFLFLTLSVLSLAACNEQWQALFRVLRVWHHYWWQAQAMAYRGE